MDKSDFFVPGKITVDMDGGLGSSGKGMINSSLAVRFSPDAVMCNNGTNAGHCVVVHKNHFTGNLDNGLSEKIFRDLGDGTVKAVFKVFPASSIVTRKCPILIAPDAGFSIDRFFEELKMIDGIYNSHPEYVLR